MGVFEDILRQISNMKLTDYLDIIVVAFLLYKILPVLLSSGGMRIGRAVLTIFIISWVTDWLDMHTLHYVVEEVMTVGIIALVIIFQPELRRMIDHIGNVKLSKFFTGEHIGQEMEGVITQTVMACGQMSRERTGALIVFARDNSLDEHTKTGTAIDAQVTEQLIRNIFFPKAALHDGAMVVVNGRVAAAGCVLPLSHSKHLSADLGTRHRAGVGVSEASDAVVVIVSEETGTISVAVDGMLKRHLPPQMLERMLRNELMPENADKRHNALRRHKSTKEGKHEK